MIPTLVSWSGGKDSCLVLHALQRSATHRVVGLFATVTQDDALVPIHGVPRVLLERQAAALGLSLDCVPLPPNATNTAYEAALTAALDRHRVAGIRAIAFGDLFLADIRAYRERLMARIGLDPLCPLWGADTRATVAGFIADGFRAIVVSIDAAILAPSYAGRMLNDRFIADLPPDIDPCGENGEYHSFVFDGPSFTAPVPIEIGASRLAGGLCYREIRENGQ